MTGTCFTPTVKEVADKDYLRSLSAEDLAEELTQRTYAARRALSVHLQVVEEDAAAYAAQMGFVGLTG